MDNNYKSSIRIKDDLDLFKIMESGQCFRVRRNNTGGFRFIYRDNVLDIREGEKRIFDISCSEEEFSDIWHAYFDLDRDYAAIRKEAAGMDEYMKRAASYGEGIRILRQDPWETLVSFIISQRKNIPSICACVEAMALRCGRSLGPYGEHAFPEAPDLRKLGDKDWDSFKLGYREAYLKELVSFPPALDDFSKFGDEKLLNELLKIKGVGIKVASCTALFAFGRMDTAPVDVWMQRIFDNVYDGENILLGKKQAGILQQYLFYYARKENKF
ncbi:MAG: hypothetical protein K5987_05040 [Lachnospiraceae bacterium]|nr:hypothetical protein [Lachnospiraceae bacterium]